MRGLRLWGVLTGEVSCPPHLLSVPPTPPSVPQVLRMLRRLIGMQPSLPRLLMRHMMRRTLTLGPWLGLALGAVTPRDFGSLTGFMFLLPTFHRRLHACLLLPPPPPFSSGITVLVIYVVLACHLYFVEVFWGLSQEMSRFRVVRVVGLSLTTVSSSTRQTPLSSLTTVPTLHIFPSHVTFLEYGDDPEYIAFVKARLRDQFLMTDLGPLRYFLGLEVSSTSDGFYISQEKYIQDLLTRAALGDERIIETPMELNFRLRSTDGDPLPDPTRYRHLVGSLVYLAVTRPDISYPSIF
ncbi:hypothetical protein QYE76_064147 [Lolium multiflorum]|uniref:Reverse transcriptase Ty1/copia-type domain-containing protein n=1 Tax=Lolium multiflorum TaxID=4521 RepID=A0AAD8S6B6_LOLMU|nr:hypothetical protein QYE76_064147 [Lolium multiflorum]